MKLKEFLDKVYENVEIHILDQNNIDEKVYDITRIMNRQFNNSDLKRLNININEFNSILDYDVIEFYGGHTPYKIIVKVKKERKL